MHTTALLHGDLFFKTYAQNTSSVVVDIGALNVNGSLKDVCPANCRYIGVDMEAGPGVDIIATDPYVLPFDNESIDIIVSSSCFEHSEMFWVLFLEMLRVLKPTGLFYLSVPLNGIFHRHPVDCWRFYPDSGHALVTWANKNNYCPVLLESFVGKQGADNQLEDMWNDYTAIFLKDAKEIANFPNRILHHYKRFDNGYIHGTNQFLNFQLYPEDKRILLGLEKK